MAIELADFMDGANIGMVKGGSGAGFAAKAFEGLWVARDIIGQELEGDEAAELGVFSFQDDTHASATELFDDAVVRERAADEGLGIRHACAHLSVRRGDESTNGIYRIGGQAKVAARAR